MAKGVGVHSSQYILQVDLALVSINNMRSYTINNVVFYRRVAQGD